MNLTAELLAGQMTLGGVKRTIAAKIVTYDLARQTVGAKEVRCSEFASAVVERL